MMQETVETRGGCSDAQRREEGGGEEEEFDSMSTEFNAALFISVGVYMTRT